MSDQETDHDKELDDAFAEFSSGVKPEEAEQPPEEAQEQEPEATPEEVEAEADESEAAEQEEAPEEVDELTKYKQEAETWKHKYNSDLGRQNALQRKLQEQEEQIKRFQANPTKNPGVSEDEWNALKEDYPDIAGAFEARLSAMKSEHQQTVEQIKAEIEPMKEQAQQQYIDAQLNRLETAHSDWREVVQTPEYAAWLNSQPGAVQSLMGSQSADDNIYLLNTFKATQPKPTSDIQQRRQKQLQQSQTIPNRTSRAKTNVIADDDYDAAFEYYANKNK